MFFLLQMWFLKNWYKNPKTSQSAFFQNAQRDVLGFFMIDQNVYHEYLSQFTEPDPEQILNILFLWKFPHGQYNRLGLLKNWSNKTLQDEKNQVFLKIQLHIDFLLKCQKPQFFGCNATFAIQPSESQRSKLLKTPKNFLNTFSIQRVICMWT